MTRNMLLSRAFGIACALLLVIVTDDASGDAHVSFASGLPGLPLRRVPPANRHLYVADSSLGRVFAFPLTNGLASTKPDPDFSFATCPGPTFLSLDAQELMYVACGAGEVQVFKQNQRGNWSLARFVQPRPPIFESIAVDAAGHLFADISGNQEQIYVYAPGASGRDAPINILRGVRAWAMAVDAAGALYADPGNDIDTLVFSRPEIEQSFNASILPTPWEKEYRGALTFDDSGNLWTRYQNGGGFSKWEAQDFVEIDPSRRHADRHYQTRDCWYPGDALGPFSLGSWESEPAYTAVVTGGYLYYSCLQGAYQSQFAVYVYDVASGEGHKPAIESIAYPTLVQPFGLVVGP